MTKLTRGQKSWETKVAKAGSLEKAIEKERQHGALGGAVSSGKFSKGSERAKEAGKKGGQNSKKVLTS